MHIAPVRRFVGKHFVIERGDNPAGTKLVKRFIRDAKGENQGYRQLLRQLAPFDPMNQQDQT
jgi:hypothetical protein